MDASLSAPMAAKGSGSAQRAGQSKPAVTWQTIAKRMLKNVKPSAFPVLVHNIPDTVSIQDLITSFASFGSLVDLRYGYTDKTQGVALGLFKKQTSAAKVLLARKSVRKANRSALIASNNAASAGGAPPAAGAAAGAAAAAAAAAGAAAATAAAARPASNPSEPGFENTVGCKPTPAGPPPKVPRSDFPGPALGTNLTGSTKPSLVDLPTTGWLKVCMGGEAFHFHHETKLYTLIDPGVGALESEWTADPKRFAKAMKCATASLVVASTDHSPYYVLVLVLYWYARAGVPSSKT
eukprot:COSAG02_NODE_1442_length_12573_cov_2.397485_8_plen_294_part_00